MMFDEVHLCKGFTNSIQIQQLFKIIHLNALEIIKMMVDEILISIAIPPHWQYNDYVCIIKKELPQPTFAIVVIVKSEYLQTHIVEASTQLHRCTTRTQHLLLNHTLMIVTMP